LGVSSIGRSICSLFDAEIESPPLTKVLLGAGAAAGFAASLDSHLPHAGGRLRGTDWLVRRFGTGIDRTPDSSSYQEYESASPPLAARKSMAGGRRFM
jgi:hypothetical protein